MTLHWWMHWFWVTSLITLHASMTTGAPQSEELQHITTDLEIDLPTQPRPSERQGRAMYYPKTPVITTPVPTTTSKNSEITEKDIEDRKEDIEDKIDNTEDSKNTPEDRRQNATVELSHPSIIWTPVNATENVTESTNTNATEIHNVTFVTKKSNLTRPDFVKDDINIDGIAESRIVTEKPLSLETTFLQTRIPPNIESSRRIIDPDEGGMDTGAIAGISFAALVLVALAGSTAFVLYRRRYLNKPQTLNDKCSNPDSSGYLDDSTIRDNSEEMYSLDNDSFLNSLEAMTIQNYWTDTVKHTKL